MKTRGCKHKTQTPAELRPKTYVCRPSRRPHLGVHEAEPAWQKAFLPSRCGFLTRPLPSLSLFRGRCLYVTSRCRTMTCVCLRHLPPFGSAAACRPQIKQRQAKVLPQESLLSKLADLETCALLSSFRVSLSGLRTAFALAFMHLLPLPMTSHGAKGLDMQAPAPWRSFLIHLASHRPNWIGHLCTHTHTPPTHVIQDREQHKCNSAKTTPFLLKQVRKAIRVGLNYLTRGPLPPLPVA